MKLRRAAVGLLLLAASVDSYAQAERLFLDKKYWVNFDWAKVEESVIYQDEGFQPKPDVPNNDPKHVFEKYQKIGLWGRSFMASVAKYPLRFENDREFNLSLLDEKGDSCTDTRLKLEQVFGRPVGPYDYTVQLMPSVGIGTAFWEWRVGKSLLRLECVQLPGSEYTAFRFTANDEYFKTAEPISLSCERTITYVDGSKAPEKISPMHLIILLSSKQVLNIDRYVIGSIIEQTNSFIRIKMERKGMMMEYTLNRVDGSLTGSATPTNHEVYGNFIGSCIKSDPNARKF